MKVSYGTVPYQYEFCHHYKIITSICERFSSCPVSSSTVLIGTIVLEWSGTVPVTYVRTNRTVYILFYFVQNMCIILFECTVITYVSRIWFKNICKQSFVIVINDLVITYVRMYVCSFESFRFCFHDYCFSANWTFGY